VAGSSGNDTASRQEICATTLFGHLNLFTASQFALDVVEFSTTEPRRAIYLGMPCANLPMRAPPAPSTISLWYEGSRWVDQWEA
jgi:hypothetical protein